MGSSSLQHMLAAKVHWSRGLPVPLRSAFRVWSPSWRLTPFDASPGLFHPDSVHGIHPFGAFPSCKVAIRFPHRPDPRDVHPTLALTSEPASRSAEPRLPGFDPCESPLSDGECLARAKPDAPLGFAPSKVFHRLPCSGSRPSSPYVLRGMQQR
jgi:hypothetical protein